MQKRPTVGVFTIGDQNDGPAALGRAVLQLPARKQNSIIECGLAASADLFHRLRESTHVVAKVAHQVNGAVEGDNKRLVFARTQYVLEEDIRGLLLKFEAVLDGIAGIDHYRHPQRQVALLLEKSDPLGWKAVIEDLEVARS